VRAVGELGVKPGERVHLTPEPSRIHRFDGDGRAIRT
jgi:multiple sugar transport system ATP-binding protein